MSIKIKKIAIIKISNSYNKNNNSNNLIDLRVFNKNNLNCGLIEIMKKLISFTEKKVQIDSKEKYRLLSFKRALHSIIDCTYEIRNIKQLLTLSGIGKGISNRLDEYFKTGNLSELNNTLDSKDQLLIQLQDIHGIGPSTAVLMCNGGINSIDDLFTKINSGQIKVNHSIQIGIKYYKDFKNLIPYDEVNYIYTQIRLIILSIYPDIIIECCGSYRRKKNLCGDIDILITHHNKNNNIQLYTIIKLLVDKGIIVDHLTELGNTKYMGVCIHSDIKIGRRIDIRFIDYDSYYYALLYFTGSVMLNREMRSIAIKKNMILNEYSLTNNYNGEKYLINSEEEIFNILGIAYLNPEERNL